MIDFTNVGQDTLVAKCTLPASVERVYDAWVDSEIFAKWFTPEKDFVCELHEFDARPGGNYKLSLIKNSGDRFDLEGKFVSLNRPKHIEMTWRWTNYDWTPEDTFLRVELEENGDQTNLLLTHERFVNSEIRTEHQNGWLPCLTRLSSILSNN